MNRFAAIQEKKTPQAGTDEVCTQRANPLFVGSLERGFDVLEAFRANFREMGVTEIAIAAKMDKSAAQRFAFTLHALGFLDKNPATRKYRLSRRVLGLAFNCLRADPLVEVATPYLADLRQKSQHRVDLSVLDGNDILYVVRLQTHREAFGATLVGRRIPAFCSSGGKAMLSRLPETEARALIENADRTPLTPFTIVDTDEIMTAIQQARRDGFAISVQECLVGEIVVSAPVVDSHGAVRAAVHIAMPLAKHDERSVRDIFAPMAVETARMIAGGGY